MVIPYNQLPENLQNDDVKQYHTILSERPISLWGKRLFDVIVSVILIVLLGPVMLVLAYLIRRDSDGPAIFRQERVTQYNRTFKIYKFRTMSVEQKRDASQLTSVNDARITPIGQKLRRLRLDELPQLFNVLKGEMSFVGTRPEVKRFVDHYTDEMKATLLLPAGITSDASIHFKDEDQMLAGAEDADKVYIEEILPLKMKYNLEMLQRFSILYDFTVMFKTVYYVIRK